MLVVFQADYWLAQYQRLLENKPDQLAVAEKTLDEDLLKFLRKHLDDEDALLLLVGKLARHRISTKEQFLRLTDEDLTRLGVWQIAARKSLLVACEEAAAASASASASASARDVVEPSAP